MGDFESIARFKNPRYPEPVPEPPEPTPGSIIETERAKARMKLHLTQTQRLQDNKKSGFGLIWGRLSQGSRDVLENSSTNPDDLPFATILEARDDPLELLRRVIATHLTIAGPNIEVRRHGEGNRVRLPT